MLRLDGERADEEDQEEDVEEGEDVVDSAEAAVFLIVFHYEREQPGRVAEIEREMVVVFISVMTGNIRSSGPIIS